MSSSSATLTDVPAYGIDLKKQILGGFQGKIKPVAVPLLYRLGLLVLAIAMVLLPLVYVGFIVLAGYGVYYHAAHNYEAIFTTVRPAKLALLVYLGPLVAGSCAVLFMIKPLFARPAHAEAPRSLCREDEPVLFAFVERICAVVGAPRPKRIDIDCEVNASASFRRGALSLLGRGDLVLTIGLPLVAGLSLAQLAGVLAHEFGHFAQGAGMRLSYIVRAINHWFLRVVYERDAWDQKLEETVQRNSLGFVVIIAQISRLAVWLTRRLLWCLMWIGNVLSSFMLRQMEFDADRYEARMVGASTFEATCRELPCLGVCYQQSLADLGTSWREGRLANSLPTLVRANRSQLQADVLNRIAEASDTRRTGLFDSHPADRDRVANARREGGNAVFHSALPASALFRDFHALSSAASLDFYRLNLGDAVRPEQLIDGDRILADRAQTDTELKAMERFFQGAAQIFRPLPLPTAPAVEAPDVGATLQRLEAARQTLTAGAAAYRRTQASFEDADNLRYRAAQAVPLVAANVRFDSRSFGLASADTAGLESRQRQLTWRIESLDATLHPFEAAAGERLAHALALLAVPRLAEGDAEVQALRGTLPELLTATQAIGIGLDKVHALRDELGCLSAVVGVLQDDAENQPLYEAFSRGCESLQSALTALRAEWEPVPYPFDHTDPSITLGTYVVAEIPDIDNPQQLASVTEGALNRAYDLYMRSLARLALLGEKLEAELGLEPLDLDLEMPAEDAGREAKAVAM